MSGPTTADPQAPAIAGATPPRREPLLAAALTLFASPLGHMYVGRLGRGLALQAAFTASGLAALALTMRSEVPAVRLVLLALVLAGLLLLAGDAVRLARRPFVPRRYNRWYGYAAAVLVLAVVGDALTAWARRSIARAYSVPHSEAMQPAILRGDYLLVSPRVPEPLARGQAVVYFGNGIVAISRVAGVGGDTLQMRDEVLLVNGAPADEPYAVHDRDHTHSTPEMLWQTEFLVGEAEDGTYAPTLDDWGPLVVPEGRLFLMGDNRDLSLDSRYFGFVPREDILGTPGWVYFSKERGGAVRWSRFGRSIR